MNEEEEKAFDAMVYEWVSERDLCYPYDKLIQDFAEHIKEEFFK